MAKDWQKVLRRGELALYSFCSITGTSNSRLHSNDKRKYERFISYVSVSDLQINDFNRQRNDYNGEFANEFYSKAFAPIFFKAVFTMIVIRTMCPF